MVRKENNREENNVFINCPYDKPFESTLTAIMFACIALGLNPILSKTDVFDSIRIKNIKECILRSKISIHDLSIMGKSENSRYNMPLEIGMAVMHHFQSVDKGKAHNIIILEPKQHLTQICCSDLNAFDPICYSKEKNFEDLIKKIAESIINIIGQKNKLAPYKIFSLYLQFQEYMFANDLWKNSTLNSLKEDMKKFVSVKNEEIEKNV